MIWEAESVPQPQVLQTAAWSTVRSAPPRPSCSPIARQATQHCRALHSIRAHTITTAPPTLQATNQHQKLNVGTKAPKWGEGSLEHQRRGQVGCLRRDGREGLPGGSKRPGMATRNTVVTHRMTIPMSSNRNPTHSLAPLLWKSMLRFVSTRSILTSAKCASCLKHRMVINPAIVSEKWWITGAFVTASTLVSSLDVFM